MAKRPVNVKLKCNPPLGTMPAPQFVLVSQLQVDASYQRSVEGEGSQALIRKIAQHWNWDLCQCLVVARRPGGALFVIDGQHRMCAAKLREDIPQLPCVVVDYSSAAAEAASFVQLNQQRRALSKLDVFKAAVAGEDPEAIAILRAIEAAGLALAPHENTAVWKPGVLANIGGIESAWRRHGETLAEDVALDQLVKVVGGSTQGQWRDRMMRERGDNPNLRYGLAMAAAMRRVLLGTAAPAALRPAVPVPAVPVMVRGNGAVPARAEPVQLVNFRPNEKGMGWCNQCDMLVRRADAEGCKSRHCSFKPKQEQVPDRAAMLNLPRSLVGGAQVAAGVSAKGTR